MTALSRSATGLYRQELEWHSGVVFGRSSRRKRTELEILRAKVASLESGMTPSAAIVCLEQSLMTGLHRLENNNVGRDSVVEHLWQKVIEQEHDLTVAIERLMELCDSLTQRIDVQVRQERELAESIRRGLPNGEPASEKARVVAGSMFAAAAPPADVIDLEEPRRNEGWHNAS